MDMCKILLFLNLFFRSIYFNVLKYLLFLISLVNIHLYNLIYIYANVLNYILFQSILTNILCKFYVSKKKNIYIYIYIYIYIRYIIHACIIILYSLPYFICMIAVILNTLYACYGFMSHCFTLENSSDELMLPIII